MNAIKNHILLIFPLFFMMLAFEFILLTNASIKHYEGLLNENYNIIIASTIEQNEAKLKGKIKNLKSIESIDISEFLSRLKDNLSATNLEKLQKSLPKFYSIKLENFPSQSELENIKESLAKSEGITRVEAFVKTQEKLNTLLSFIKFSLFIFLLIIAALSLMLFLKQMKIWLFEHTERVEIMLLFGAPFWFRSMMLFRMVVFDCVICLVLLLVFFTQIYSLDIVQESLEIAGLSLPSVNFFLHLPLVFFVVLFISLICVNSVMFRVKR